MNVAQLHARWLAEGRLVLATRSLTLDPTYLEMLHGDLDTLAVRQQVCPYFPGGRIALTELEALDAPAPDGVWLLRGSSASPPWAGLSVALQVQVRASAGGRAALVLTLEAWGRRGPHAFDLGQAFPSYADSWLRRLTFSVDADPRPPSFRLASTSADDEAAAGLVVTTLLDVSSLHGVGAELFIGPRAPGEDLLPIVGAVLAPAPAAGALPAVVRPYLTLATALPSAPGLLGGALQLDDVRLGLSGRPAFDTATGREFIDARLTWLAELVIGGATGFRVPLAVVLTPGRGIMRVTSDLRQALSIELSALAALIPGADRPAGLADYRPRSQVALTQLGMVLDVEPAAPRLVQSISATVEVSAEDRWPIIRDVIELDAIALRFFVADPLHAPSVELTVSALLGLGRAAVMELAAVVRPDPADLRFHGELLKPDGEDPPLDATEVLTQFLGRADHDGFPSLRVQAFYFDVAPVRRSFAGYLELGGDWAVPGAGKVVLEHLALSMSREGETSTTFRAEARIALGDVVMAAAADYHSGGSGWIFEGGTAESSALPLGALVTRTLELMEVPTTPLPSALAGLSELQLYDLWVRFDTSTHDFSARGTLALPLGEGGPAAALTLHVDVVNGAAGGPRQVGFGGTLHLGERDFAVAFDDRSGTPLLVASYSVSASAPVDLQTVVKALSPALGAQLPAGLHVALDHAQLAIAHPGADGQRFLFGVELGAGIELSRLPLVGAALDRGQTLAVVLQLVVASHDFSQPEVARINALSAPTTTPFPDAAVTTSEGNVTARVALDLGGTTAPLALPLAWPDPAAAPLSAAPREDGSAAIMQWFAVQRAFGAFHFERAGVGLSADRQSLQLVIDASLDLAGLRLSLLGLGAELALAELGQGQLRPRFHLDGLGLELQRGELTLGGALLRRETPGGDAYDGAVTIHYGQLGIVGVGSFTHVGEHPSVFVYAVVDYPIGGPPFFFVEALSFGFGYNRALRMPPLDRVASFPLVAAVRSPAAAGRPAELVASMSAHLAPTEGEHFVAAGARFTTFEVIDGVVLLAAVFGQHFEIDVLGVATLSSPPRASGRALLMSAELAIMARYRPDQGELMVRGGLMPNAYLFSADCHLTGGFAFGAWFERGDFVLTMGGYHPAFRAPAHYPVVPRLALSWQVDRHLSLKADAYFAMTPGAFMAGGHLRANWQDEDLHAWFDAGIDCLVAWQPYQYEARVQVAIGATYRTWFHTFSVELSARLEIWGPPFSGRAHVSWYVLSFDVEFGRPRHDPPDLTWDELRAAFLPAQSITLSARAGRAPPHGALAAAEVQRNQAQHLGTVNARDLEIAIGSVIPLVSATAAGTSVAGAGESLGVAPMGAATLTSKLTVEVRRGTQRVDDAFTCEATSSGVPTALWGTHRSKSPNAPTLVRALTGLTLRTAATIPGAMVPQVAEDAPVTRHHVGAPPAAATMTVPTPPEGGSASRVRATVQDPLVRGSRAQVLDALLTGAGVDDGWGGATVAEWRSAPRLVRPAEPR